MKSYSDSGGDAGEKNSEGLVAYLKEKAGGIAEALAVVTVFEGIVAQSGV